MQSTYATPLRPAFLVGSEADVDVPHQEGADVPHPGEAPAAEDVQLPSGSFPQQFLAKKRGDSVYLEQAAAAQVPVPMQVMENLFGFIARPTSFLPRTSSTSRSASLYGPHMSGSPAVPATAAPQVLTDARREQALRLVPPQQLLNGPHLSGLLAVPAPAAPQVQNGPEVAEPYGSPGPPGPPCTYPCPKGATCTPFSAKAKIANAPAGGHLPANASGANPVSGRLPAKASRPNSTVIRFTASDGRLPADVTVSDGRLPAHVNTSHTTTRGHVWPKVAPSLITYGAIVVVPILSVLCWIGLMMAPPGGGEAGTNYRVPPRWDPAMERTGYSFRTYMMDLNLWMMLTDLAPHQQAAAIIMRLGGAAKELARTMTPQEIFQGGVVNGVQLDPVSYTFMACTQGLHNLEKNADFWP